MSLSSRIGLWRAKPCIGASAAITQEEEELTWSDNEEEEDLLLAVPVEQSKPLSESPLQKDGWSLSSSLKHSEPTDPGAGSPPSSGFAGKLSNKHDPSPERRSNTTSIDELLDDIDFDDQDVANVSLDDLDIEIDLGEDDYDDWE